MTFLSPYVFSQDTYLALFYACFMKLNLEHIRKFKNAKMECNYYIRKLQKQWPGYFHLQKQMVNKKIEKLRNSPFKTCTLNQVKGKII